MDDAEVVEGVLVVGVKRLTERMENSLECIVVSRREKFASDDMGVADIPGWVDCLVVIGIAMVNMSSWVGHVAPPTTMRQALTLRASKNGDISFHSEPMLYT
ncbi:hypothetical protein [Halogeometricum pallidum]|uniref:hypothetical protein n=1 Tax=Halogeometricum pallidum TaxID=411361 RepID=UPI001360B1C8|nr:hypothetical protein [Halogeometricum pallidum]